MHTGIAWAALHPSSPSQTYPTLIHLLRRASVPQALLPPYYAKTRRCQWQGRRAMNETIIRTAQEADFDDVTTLYEEFHAFHVRGVPAWLRLPESSDEPAKCEGERAQIRAQLGMIVRDPSAALLLAEASG